MVATTIAKIDVTKTENLSPSIKRFEEKMFRCKRTKNRIQPQTIILLLRLLIICIGDKVQNNNASI